MLTQQIQKGESKKLELKEKLPSNEAMIVELQRQRFNKTFNEEENFEFDLDSLDLDVIYNEFKKIGKNCDYEKLKNLKLIKQNSNQDLPTNAKEVNL